MAPASSSGNMLAAKTWYFFVCAAQVFMLPYVSLFLQRDLAWEPWKVGLIQGLRPWVAAPASLLLCTLADRIGAHCAVLLVCFTVSTALRGALAIAAPGAEAALLLIAEVVGAPVGTIVDAEVVARCEGEYGKQRVWASIGWGGLSTVAGALISHEGVRSGILAYVLLSVPALAAAAVMFAPGLRRARLLQAVDSASSGGRAGDAVGGAGEGSNGEAVREDSQPAAAGRIIGEKKIAVPHVFARNVDGEGSRAAAHPLRVQLLSDTTRTPSPGPLASPRDSAGLGPTSPEQLAPTLPVCAMAAVMASQGPDDSGSCCSTPRSTAALLDDRASQHATRCATGPAMLASDDLCPAAAVSAPPMSPLSRGLWGRALEPRSPGGGSSAGAVDDEAVVVRLRLRGDSRRALLKGFEPSDGPGDEEETAPAGGGGKATVAPAVGSETPAVAVAESEDASRGGSTLSLLLQPAVATFLLRALVIGFGLGCQGAFAFLLVSQMGGTELLMGLMLVFSILTEAPAFQFQDALLSRVSVGAVMQGSMALLSLRLALYALLPQAPTPWLVLPVELLHGVTFATAWGAGIVACKRLAPPHLNTTMQSIFSTVWGGVGSGLGGILGGLLMQKLGTAQMFGIASGIVMGGCVLAYAVDVATGGASAGASKETAPTLSSGPSPAVADEGKAMAAGDASPALLAAVPIARDGPKGCEPAVPNGSTKE